jgi:hypothetical protein
MQRSGEESLQQGSLAQTGFATILADAIGTCDLLDRFVKFAHLNLRSCEDAASKHLCTFGNQIPSD